ncbi:bacteriophage antitermination protein Q [Serratia marcescens]|uniref:bacteriophage antitermination protein Q n=1 Tax=Serratia marcescens TaxID=615 RepID=UPI003AAEF42A
MNAQQLEYIRINLRAALVDSSGGTKGQLEAFAEHPPADKERNPRRPVHVVALDDGRGGVRQVKAENSALYVLETRSRRRPLPPMKEHAFATCTWRRAVMTLDDYQQAWLRYCYGFDLSFKYQIAICEYIWKAYEAELADKKIQRRMKNKLASLVWLAVQDVATKNSNESYREYAGAALASLMSITRQTWAECYALHWQELKVRAMVLDLDALQTVFIHREQVDTQRILQNLTE